MSVPGPTVDTFGLFASIPGLRINLRGLPWGLPATHDPDHAVLQIPTVVEMGPTGYSHGQPEHLHAEDEIALLLEHVSRTQFLDYQDFVARARYSTCQFSPLGMDTYLPDEWLLVSTTKGWVETSFGRWRGPLVLWKQGVEVIP